MKKKWPSAVKRKRPPPTIAPKGARKVPMKPPMVDFVVGFIVFIFVIVCLIAIGINIGMGVPAKKIESRMQEKGCVRNE